MDSQSRLEKTSKKKEGIKEKSTDKRERDNCLHARQKKKDEEERPIGEK